MKHHILHEGLIIGGFGGGISTEVFEYDNSCLGDDAIPFIPGAPGGNVEVRSISEEKKI